MVLQAFMALYLAFMAFMALSLALYCREGNKAHTVRLSLYSYIHAVHSIVCMY